MSKYTLLVDFLNCDWQDFHNQMIFRYEVGLAVRGYAIKLKSENDSGCEWNVIYRMIVKEK